MKNIIFLFVLLSARFFGQISLEHTYTGGSTLGGNPQSESKQPLMVKLELDSEKYVIIDRSGKTVNFYNLNHTFYKSISFAATTDINPFIDSYGILYISQTLFDTDNEIEFMYVDTYFDSATLYATTQIVNEDGSILFSVPNGAPFIKPSVPQQQVPIYNTPMGTKLILSMTTGDANVYSLGGQLTTNIIHNSSSDISLGNSFPNPTTGLITIPYTLPENETKATLKIYDVNGKELKSYQVDNNFHNITLNTAELSNGTYYYQLVTAKGQGGAKKIIKIE